MRPPRFVRRRRVAARHMTVQISGACWGAPAKSAAASRQRGAGSGGSAAARPTLLRSPGSERTARMGQIPRPPSGPLGCSTIEIAGAALPTQSVPLRAETQGEERASLWSRRCDPVGPSPQAGSAGRTMHLGAFDCPRCGWPIGRGHADNCPSRPVRARLGLPLAALVAATLLAAVLTLAAVAIATGAGAVALLALYQPPAPMQGRGRPPAVPARAGHQT